MSVFKCICECHPIWFGTCIHVKPKMYPYIHVYTCIYNSVTQTQAEGKSCSTTMKLKRVLLLCLYILFCVFFKMKLYIYTFLFAFKPEFLLLNEQRGVMMSVHIL